VHVLYVAFDPLKYPRIEKIAHALRMFENVKFDTMIPKFRLASRRSRIERFLVAPMNYATVLLQILFVRADMFWVANCPDILVLPLILRRKRYILDYRAVWALDVKKEFEVGLLVRLASLFENIALGHAQIITLTTSRLSGKAQSFRKPMFVIPNYPMKSFGTTSSSPKDFRSRFGYREDDKIVLFVGKLTSAEGADLLPKIIGDVLSKAKAIFWIVGDGPLYPFLEKFAGQFRGLVRLFGWQPHDSIPDFIAASDVCIAVRAQDDRSPYCNEEGIFKLSEYMFFEKPIVACGVVESDEYLLVDEKNMASGILSALNGSVRASTRKTWEEYSEREVQRVFDLVLKGKLRF
jgi:glycosyltransferase involved in cell wall biosynthesis